MSKFVRYLLEGVKLVALFGAVATVVWLMPERAPEASAGVVSPAVVADSAVPAR